MQKILLLEDDRNLNRGISLKLEKEGYQVFSAFSVKEAEKSGLDFCREIRKKSQVYLIFLTALDSEVDMVNAYDLGADDYITKPFSLLVLVSKVHALMRRARQAGEEQKTEIRSGELRVSYQDMRAYRGGEELSLSKKELQLLLYFMENDVDGQFVDDNTVPVNVSRLKRKIGGEWIQNVRGMGYLWIQESVKE